MKRSSKNGSMFRRSLRRAGKVLPSPSQAAGVATIRGGLSLIRDLWAQLRVARAMRGSKIVSKPEDSRDFISDAQAHGMSAEEIRRRIAIMRTKTKRSAMVTAGLAAVVFIAWAWNMITEVSTVHRWWSAFEYLPFFAAALLYSFRAGWLNWQLRLGRRGSAGEYLTTDRGFWPG